MITPMMIIFLSIMYICGIFSVAKIIWARRNQKIHSQLTITTYITAVLFIITLIFFFGNLCGVSKKAEAYKQQINELDRTIKQYYNDYNQYPESLFFIPNSELYDKKLFAYTKPDSEDSVYIRSADDIFFYSKKLNEAAKSEIIFDKSTPSHTQSKSSLKNSPLPLKAEQFLAK